MSENAVIETTEQAINKSAIRDFAVSARRKLMEKVSMQANRMGFFADNRTVQYEFEDDKQFKINGKTFDKKQANILKTEISRKGFESVIDEVAYTWFNRFVALYYMEVHNYIDNGLNIISSIDDLNSIAMKAPNCLKTLDKEILFKAIQENNSDEVYKTLIIAQCNELNSKLPFLFEKISDYTELLFPSGMLNNDSIIREMLALDKSNWDEVEIIGWLYQYYISEKKDEVFAGLKKGKKINKDDVPAATQIFTPKWIVKYMVENSVGKMWLESHPNMELQNKFKYYLESAEQDEDVKQKLNEIIDKSIMPENIKVLDPACGSGHILVTAFEVLYEIYKSVGYIEDEIPQLILTKNLYGLDICNRASQLAQLAVMMMARKYDKNIFNKNIELNITSIQDSNWIDSRVEECLMNDAKNKLFAQNQINLLQNTFLDAKEYGSIIDVKDFDFDFWNERLVAIQSLNMGLLYTDVVSELQTKLPQLIKQARIMQQKYECVLSNPPYMGNRGMSPKLSEYVKKNFKNTKTDFFSIFMEKNYHYTKLNGYTSMITQPSWLFLSSFEELRKQILDNQNVMSVLHMGRGIFGIDFGSCAFTFRKTTIKDFIGSYFRLHQRTFQYINPEDIENLYLTAKENHEFMFDFSSYKNNAEIEIKDDDNVENIEHSALRIYYTAKQSDFHSIPGSPIAYWASDRVREIFKENKSLGKMTIVRNGMKTGGNEEFLRLWQEIDFDKFNARYIDYKDALESNTKWFPYNKGGEYRKWYGNNDYVVNWQNAGRRIFYDAKTDGRNVQDYPSELKFKPSISWSLISSGAPSFRYKESNLSDIAGMSCWYLEDKDILLYILGFANSTIAHQILKLLAPTINYQAGDIGRLPIIVNQEKVTSVTNIVNDCIDIVSDDWDSFETSWDFEMHPLLRFRSKISQGLADDLNKSEVIHIKPSVNGDFRQYNWTPNDRIEECFLRWKEYKQEQFNKLKANEEELNRLFIEIYGLQDEMTPEVADKDITVALADEVREIKSLLSYAVGCMFGRYSLDEKGLAFAGGEFDSSKYKTLEVDEDAILPILSDTWFEDDIIEEFKRFLKKAFGELYFNENMQYIASVLNGKSSENPEKVIRNYFLKDFYKDHLQTYKKRPIYWMFTSGKEKAFNCLVYLHRYDKTTLSRIRKDYLHEYQAKLDRAKAQAEDEGNVKLDLMYSKYQTEILEYDRKLQVLADSQIELDLDDGVKVNYAKFKGLLESEKDIIGKVK